MNSGHHSFEFIFPFIGNEPISGVSAAALAQSRAARVFMGHYVRIDSEILDMFRVLADANRLARHKR